YIVPPPIDTLIDSTIINSTTFKIVELKSGRHELFRQQTTDQSPLLDYDSGVVWNSVIPYQRDLPDTIQIYRYYSVDSTLTVSFSTRYYLGQDLRIIAKKDSGFVSLSIDEL